MGKVGEPTPSELRASCQGGAKKESVREEDSSVSPPPQAAFPRGTREGWVVFGERSSNGATCPKWSRSAVLALSKVSMCLQPEQVLGEEAGRERAEVPADLSNPDPKPFEVNRKIIFEFDTLWIEPFKS